MLLYCILPIRPYDTHLQLLIIRHHEGGRVVLLAEVDALLAQYVVRGCGVEEDGGQAVRGGIVSRPERAGLASALAVSDHLVPAAVDLARVGRGEPPGGGVDAGARVSDGLEAVPGAQALWLHALEAGDQLDGRVGGEVELEGQGQHVRVEARGEEGLRGGRGRLLDLVQEVGEDLDGGRGVGECPVCERVGGHGC